MWSNFEEVDYRGFVTSSNRMRLLSWQTLLITQLRDHHAAGIPETDKLLC